MKKLLIITLLFSSFIATAQTTVDKQTLEAFRLNNYSSLQSNLSSFLSSYIVSRNILSLDDFSYNPVLDFRQYKNDITALANLKGIEFFGPTVKEIYFPVLSAAIITTPINITNFRNLEVLDQNSTALNYQAFTGSMAGLTTLKRIYACALVLSPTSTLTLPTFGQNTGLTNVYLLGTGFQFSVNSSNFTGLRNCTLLSEFRMTFLNGTNVTAKAAVDLILAELKIQKQNGGAISIIDFTNSPAPTGTTSNADYVWLIANGVTVTLGTL